VTSVKTVTKTKLFDQLLVPDSRPLILFFIFYLVICIVGLAGELCCHNRGFSSSLIFTVVNLVPRNTRIHADAGFSGAQATDY